MKKYLVSYDLKSPETIIDYNNLKAYIKSYSMWAKPLQSVWFILSDKMPGEIRDEIKSRIDGNDKVLVIEVKGNWATTGISKEVTDWMKEKV